MSERRCRKFNKCENEFEEKRMKRKMGKGTLVVQLTKSEGRSALNGVNGLGKEWADTRNAGMEELIISDNRLDCGVASMRLKLKVEVTDNMGCTQYA